MTSNKSAWWSSMIKKHGSEEAVREFMRANRAKAANHGKGGFAYLKEHDPEKLTELVTKGGRISRRRKNPYEATDTD